MTHGNPDAMNTMKRRTYVEVNCSHKHDLLSDVNHRLHVTDELDAVFSLFVAHLWRRDHALSRDGCFTYH